MSDKLTVGIYSHCKNDIVDIDSDEHGNRPKLVGRMLHCDWLLGSRWRAHLLNVKVILQITCFVVDL